LSERYPLINQPGGATVIPVIDNFYLDMNGIVHNCTHGNDTDLKVRMTEETMFSNIFQYCPSPLQDRCCPTYAV
jgi:5'-3' exoribonuclease 1